MGNHNSVSYSNNRLSVASENDSSAAAVASSISHKPRNSSSNNHNNSSSGGGGGTLKEHKRHGVVVVKIMNTATNRRNDNHITHAVSPKGSVLFGSVYNPTVIQKALQSVDYPLLPPGEIMLPDSRAHKLLVTHCSGGWHLVPFPEPFSRHSGTCLILGDRNIASPPHQIKIGDCFRLGSVGLVVSEMKAAGCSEQRIDQKTLEFLKDESLAFDSPEDLAPLAAEEEKLLKLQQQEQEEEQQQQQQQQKQQQRSAAGSPTNTQDGSGDYTSTATAAVAATSAAAAEQSSQCNCSGGVGNGERFICYMCYETHDTEEDALVAPCDCKGDTRYLHVQCLQKWYHSSLTGAQTQVIRTTGNGAPACKICGSAYKTCFMRPDGSRVSLLEANSNGPYLSLVVVTKHDTNPGLFNTKFRLNFGEQARVADMHHLTDEELNTITIGRSSSCNMILDYRTVSTIHARITYANGGFYLTDRRSSNGTMVYLQDPMLLPYSNNSLKLRMGRTTLSLQAKRNWSSAMRNALGSQISQQELESTPTAEEIQEILADSNSYSAMKDSSSVGGAEGNEEGTLIGDGIGPEQQAMEERWRMISAHSHTMRTMNANNSVEGERDDSTTLDASGIQTIGGGFATPLSIRGGGGGITSSELGTRESTTGSTRFSPRDTMLATELIADMAALAELEDLEDLDEEEAAEAEEEALGHEQIYGSRVEQHNLDSASSPPHLGGRIMEAIHNSSSNGSARSTPLTGLLNSPQSDYEPIERITAATAANNPTDDGTSSMNDLFTSFSSSPPPDERKRPAAAGGDEPTLRLHNSSLPTSARLDEDSTAVAAVGPTTGNATAELTASPTLRAGSMSSLVIFNNHTSEAISGHDSSSAMGNINGGSITAVQSVDEEYSSRQVPVAGAFTAYGQIVERRSTTPTMSLSPATAALTAAVTATATSVATAAVAAATISNQQQIQQQRQQRGSQSAGIAEKERSSSPTFHLAHESHLEDSAASTEFERSTASFVAVSATSAAAVATAVTNNALQRPPAAAAAAPGSRSSSRGSNRGSSQLAAGVSNSSSEV